MLPRLFANKLSVCSDVQLSRNCLTSPEDRIADSLTSANICALLLPVCMSGATIDGITARKPSSCNRGQHQRALYYTCAAYLFLQTLQVRQRSLIMFRFPSLLIVLWSRCPLSVFSHPETGQSHSQETQRVSQRSAKRSNLQSARRDEVKSALRKVAARSGRVHHVLEERYIVHLLSSCLGTLSLTTSRFRVSSPSVRRPYRTHSWIPLGPCSL